MKIPAKPLHRTSLLAVTVVPLFLGVGACNETTDAPTTGAAARTATTPATVTSTTVPRATATARNPIGGGCANKQLRLATDNRHIPGNGTAGRKAIGLRFTNISGDTCTLRGYPGAATVDTDNNRVTDAKRTLRGDLGGLPAGATTTPAVVVSPGAFAYTLLEGKDLSHPGAANAGCVDTLPRIAVTPPDTTATVVFKQPWPACESLEIHPVQPAE